MENRIAKAWRDRDGYWVELAPGYHDALNPGSHIINERSMTAAAKAVAEDVELCSCRKCWP